MLNIITFSLCATTMAMDLICDMPALIGIIQRSGGMDRNRRLDDVGVLLELLPSLDSISIRSGHLTANTIKILSSGKLGHRLCEICLDILHDADQILSMVKSRYQNATRCPDSQQIEEMPCQFKTIMIPCTAVNSPESYDCEIEFLSSMCNADIRLDIAEDQGLEEDGRPRRRILRR